MAYLFCAYFNSCMKGKETRAKYEHSCQIYLMCSSEIRTNVDPPILKAVKVNCQISGAFSTPTAPSPPALASTLCWALSIYWSLMQGCN